MDDRSGDRLLLEPTLNRLELKREKRRKYINEYNRINRVRVNAHARDLRSANKDVYNARSAEYRKKYLGKIRNSWFKHEYGIPAGDWDKMVLEQSGCCGLCGEQFGNTKKLDPVVDHNHVTDVVRELIHRKCNVGLGQFNDSLVVCEMAVAYLKKHIGGRCD